MKNNSKVILTLDCERTYVQFALYELPDNKEFIKGKIEPVGSEVSELKYKIGEQQYSEFHSIDKISSALKIVKNLIQKYFSDKLDQENIAIGHRVVHGGTKYLGPVEIDDSVKHTITEYYDLAPLHNPYNLAGINESKQLWPKSINFACFDSSFHHTISEVNYRYPIPEKFYIDNSIRKYGFHGLSHNYVLMESSRILAKTTNSLNLISLHLGKGSSICAIENGLSIDTSMGFTPTGGLMMTTRCGDIDPEIPIYLLKIGYSRNEVESILLKESGLLGVAKKSTLDEIVMNYNTDTNCKLAIDMYIYRIKKYIGAYYILLKGNIDAIVFTGNFANENPFIREKIASDLNFIGAEIDLKKNNNLKSNEGIFSKPKSKIKLINIPQNQFLIIAKLVYDLINKHK